MSLEGDSFSVCIVFVVGDVAVLEVSLFGFACKGDRFDDWYKGF